MGLRYLLLLAAVAAIVMVVRSLLRRRQGTGSEDEPPPIEDMVKCRICGVHLPRSQAIETDDGPFCSRRHLEDFRRRD